MQALLFRVLLTASFFALWSGGCGGITQSQQHPVDAGVDAATTESGTTDAGKLFAVDAGVDAAITESGTTDAGKLPVFVFQKTAPHARSLPYDPKDEVPAGKKGNAAVFVYAEFQGKTYVLLGRRASWLSGPGTWATFGGIVEAKDTDSSGKVSFARAAEHELYEESVTVYAQTDANRLRTFPLHVHTPQKGGAVCHTFFAKLPYIPKEVFEEGYAYAKNHNVGSAYAENDRYLWVLLSDIRSVASAPWTPPHQYTVTDVKGSKQTLPFFFGFVSALKDPTYGQILSTLP